MENPQRFFELSRFEKRNQEGRDDEENWNGKEKDINNW